MFRVMHNNIFVCCTMFCVQCEMISKCQPVVVYLVQVSHWEKFHWGAVNACKRPQAPLVSLWTTHCHYCLVESRKSYNIPSTCMHTKCMSGGRCRMSSEDIYLYSFRVIKFCFCKLLEKYGFLPSSRVPRVEKKRLIPFSISIHFLVIQNRGDNWVWSLGICMLTVYGLTEKLSTISDYCQVLLSSVLVSKF